jgi:flagellar biosynthetic protein FlhB
VVRSRDFATAIGILVSLKLFSLMLPTYLESFRSLFRLVFVPLGETGAMENAMSVVFMAAAALFVKMVLPLAVVPVAIVLAAWCRAAGFSGKNMMPKAERLSPMKNLGNLVSQKHMIGFAVSVAKAAVLGFVLVHVTRSSMCRPMSTCSACRWATPSCTAGP